MILPRMSHMVVPISKENMVTQTSIMVSGSCLPYPVHHAKCGRVEHTISQPAIGSESSRCSQLDQACIQSARLLGRAMVHQDKAHLLLEQHCLVHIATCAPHQSTAC